MSKKSKVLLSLFSVVLVAMLCASITLSAIAVTEIGKTSKAVKSYTGIAEDVDSEDDVLIANQFMIKSTTQISDAYISKDTSKLSDRDKETLDLASKVLEDIIKPKMSDYEKERAVYVYLTTKLTSTDGILTVITPEGENYEPHDVLKNKSAVCVGYATTFRLFMQMLGIECKVVHSSDLSHSWDLVKLDDGWYHVDCYSDNNPSGVTMSDYGEEPGSAIAVDNGNNQSDNDTATYANFNMDDSYCSLNHSWSKEYYPAADGKKYNYILNNTKVLKSIYDLPDYVAKLVSKKKGMIACRFENFNEKAQYTANYMVDSIQNNFTNDTRSVMYQWSTDSEGRYILIINMMYYGDSSENVDDKTTEKVDKAVFEAIDKYELNN